MDENKDLAELYEQKKDIVFKILRLSNDTSFNAEKPEQNAEKYISFINAREKLLDDLKAVSAKLDSAKSNSSAAVGNNSEIFDGIEREIADMITQILRLETKISDKANAAVLDLKIEIKKMNEQKKLINAYDV